MNRRDFCHALAAGGVATAATPSFALDDPKKPRMTTFTYKQVGSLEIKADVHRADDDLPRPVVVWVHGGALIMGNRTGIDGRIKQSMLDAGYAIVSIDYRLAPETKLPAIISDVEDAFAWIRRDGPRLFHADGGRIAVAGGSAGGYLTLIAGVRVRPRPAVLVSLWGYGDLVGDWYSKPSPHARHRTTKLTADEARRPVTGPPIADSRDRNGDGGPFYQLCRQLGTWPKEVSGWDSVEDVSRFVPFMPERNVTKDFPPTLLIHGTKDTDVPYEQSVRMADEFERHGVEHKLITIDGGEHGLAGGDPETISAAYRAAAEFIQRRME